MTRCIRIRILAFAAAAAFVVASFGSCSIYKDYKRPEIASLDSLFGPGLNDTSALASYDWKDVFKDPLLVGYIEKGLSANKDIECAQQAVVAARAALMTAKGAFLPSLSIGANGSVANSPERYGGTVYSYGFPLTLSWDIDFAGGTFNRMRKSKAELLQAQIQTLSVQTNVISAIADTYYTLLKLDAQLEISRSTWANWKKNVQVMQAMMEAGMTNKASISQTQANSCAIEASLFDIEYQIGIAENTLAVLLGTTPRHFERSTLHQAAFASDLCYGVPSSLLSHRPDVMLSEQQLRKAFYDTAIARASFYPSLRLSGEVGWEKALTSPVGLLVSAAASLAEPLYAGGRIRRNLQIAKARQAEALAAFEKSLLTAGSQVNNAVYLCKSARGKAEVRARQIEALETAVTSTTQLMRHSESTYLEVLTAMQSLLSAQLQQINDIFDAAEGNIALFRALGGGMMQ